MTVYAPLQAVSDGLATVLDVASLTTLAPGGIWDELPQDTTYPCVLFEAEDLPDRAFGSKPGTGPGNLSAIRVTLHVFTQSGVATAGMRTAQIVMATAIQLIQTLPTVTGYHAWAVFHDDTIPIGTTVVAGLPVQELVAHFRLYVEES